MRLFLLTLLSLAAGLLAALVAPAPSFAVLRPAFRVRVGEPSGPKPPVFSEDGRSVFLADADGRVRSLETSRGREQWFTAVRCGRHAFALRAGRIICFDGRRPRLLVLDANKGRLLTRESVDGGPYVSRVVGDTLVLHEPATGRILGYDIANATWRFDHRTDANALPGVPYRPLSLGTRYLYTEDEWRTLWAIDVTDGRQAVAARSDTPVRLDAGRDARVTHGFVLSHDDHHVLAFDIAHAQRAWRLDVREALGSEAARILLTEVWQGQLHVAVEVSTKTRDGFEAEMPPRWVAVLVVQLRSGRIRQTVPLNAALPLPARLRLELGFARRCDAAVLTGLVRVADRLVASFAAACEPRASRFPSGWLVGVDLTGRAASWATPPGTASRVLKTPEGVYGLWGGPGIPHGERSVVELDAATGRPLARHVVGYTPTWGRVHGKQLWLGTSSGTVVVYDR